jgi:hypothetical protein
MLHSLGRKGILSLLLVLLSVGIVIAQTSCPELVNEALLAVDENCNAAGRNEACYGYDQVEASFLVDVADDFFSQPASISAIADLETIRTAPLNTETGVWGVAVMNIQADLPNTIPGQSVTFVLLGDVEVENAVAPEDAFVPSEGLDVTVNIAAGANVRSGPGTNYNVIGGLMNGQTVLADGVSEDGEWLRVAYRERPAWLSISVINNNDPALRELPTLSADLQTPMQAFYLRTGIGQPECEEAPDDILLVQGPENININITVNGANVQLGSSGAFRIVMREGFPFLELLVFDGHFVIGGKTFTRGQHGFVCLGDESSRGLDGEDNDLVATCEPSDPELIDSDEFGAEWCILEDLPSEILNYGLEILCPGETPPPVNTGGGGGGGSATDSLIEGISCEGFTLLSPLGPVNSGNHTFSWTEVVGPNISYELVFYNGGVQVDVFPTTNTSHNLNLGAETHTGGAFQWEVRAFSNGQYLCVTYRTQEIARTSELDPNASGFSATMTCTLIGRGRYIADISYTGGGGDTVTATVSSGAGPQSQSSTGNNGSFSFTGTAISSINVSKASGESIGLGYCGP